MHQLALTAIEVALCGVASSMGACNIVLDVATSGALDPEPLAAAVKAACDRHPLARACLPEQGARWWSIEPRAELHPVEVVEVGDGAIDDVLERVLGTPISLEAAPPLRVVLVRADHGDHFVLATNHVAFDGVSALRFATSVARAYRGIADGPDPVDLDAARDLSQRFPRPAAGEMASWALDGVTQLAEAFDPPARLTASAAAGGDGNGIVTTTVDLSRAVTERRDPSAVTRNDVLLAALHVAVDRWNAAQGARCGRVSVSMPVNGRGLGWTTEVVSNLASFMSVSTRARERGSMRAAVDAVAAQTSPRHRTLRATAAVELMRLGQALPASVTGPAAAVLAAPLRDAADTAVLSNLGRVDPPRFDDGPASVWFFAPLAAPVGVAVCAITIDEMLHLAMTYRRDLFDRAAASALLALVVDLLDAS